MSSKFQTPCFSHPFCRVFLRREAVDNKTLFFILVLLVMIVYFVAGCAKNNEANDMPEVLNIGILPDESETTLRKRYSSLFEYLSKKLDVPYQFIIPENYMDLVGQFERGNIDLAYFGGYTFIQAFHKSNAVPLVMRDIDVRFTSYFISNRQIPTNRIEDMQGKIFSFGSRLSTSGHLMPRFYLKEKKIIPETYFSNVRYSGAHDKTAILVRDGIVDFGVANSIIIDKMMQDGRLSQGDIHIVWETPPYPDYVWALRSGFTKFIQMKIRNAFLSLSPANKEHARILANVDAGGFLPASMEDYARLDKVAHQFGLMDNVSSR